MPVRKIQIPSNSIRALVETSSVNDAERTVEVIFSTESEVEVFGWSEANGYHRFLEILSHADGAPDFTRLNAGAPVLNNHERWSGVNGQLGVVMDAKIEKTRGVATLKFSKRDDVTPVWNDIKDGIIKGVSVGYRVTKYSDIDVKPGQTPKRRADKWEAFEISMAPIPADVKAGVRSYGSHEKPDNLHEATIETTTPAPGNKSRTMKKSILDFARSIAFFNTTFLDELAARDGMTLEAARAAIIAELNENGPGEAPANNPTPPPANGTRSGEQLIADERDRVRDIRETFRAAGIDDIVLQNRYIDEGASVDSVRAAVIKKLGASAAQTSPVVKVLGADEQEKLRQSIEGAMLLRTGERKLFADNKELMDRERNDETLKQYRNMTLIDVAKDCLTRAGHSHAGLDKMEIAGRSFTSNQSDFPILLSGANRRVLLAAYQSVADSWRRFCTTGSVSDFRVWSRLRWGSLTRLDALAENAEYQTKSIPDAEKETVQASTYGNKINVSRQMIVNDDLNALVRLTAMLGRAASRGIEIDVYSMFALNSGFGPTMSDGNPLFHTSHNNVIASGAVPSVAQFEAMRLKMAQQQEPGQSDYLDLRPQAWVGPITLGGQARVYNESLYDPDATGLQKPNIVRGLFNDIVDSPRLSGNPYYAFADSSIEPVFEVTFLDGNEAPFLDSQQGWNVDGMEWKVRHDYGVGAIGWRGAVRNAGA